MVSRKVESLRRRRNVETCENFLNGFEEIGTDAAPVAVFIQTLQATMLEAPNHPSIVG